LTTSNRGSRANKKEGKTTENAERYGVEFFKQEYGKRNMICDGTKCDVIGNCVVDPWGKEGPVIVQRLAEISVKTNQEIAELFRKVNAGKLPAEPPIFKLVMHHCPSHKSVPIDFGD